MTAQSSIEAAPAKPIGRPFEKGQSGNPGGRPKGLSKRIREQTGDGADLVVYMVEVFRDETAPRRGKPVQTISTEVDEAEQRRRELANIPTPELQRQLAELRARLNLEELPETSG